MKKLLVAASCLLMAGLLGCSKKQTNTTIYPDGRKVTVTRDKSFWESDNLSGYYALQSKSLETHERVANKKIEAINNIDNNIAYSTKTERTQAAVINKLLISSIRYDQLKIAPPKIIADVADRNLLGVLGWGTNVAMWLDNRNNTSRNQSPSIEISNEDGTIFYGSDFNYDLAEGVEFYNGESYKLGESSTFYNGSAFDSSSYQYSNESTEANEYGLF